MTVYDRDVILGAAYQILNAVFYGTALPVLPLIVAHFDAEEPIALNVTLRTAGIIRGSMSGSGNTWSEKLSSAVLRSALDTRFSGPIVLSDLPFTSIEVWIETKVEAIPLPERILPTVLTLGLHGVEVQCQSHFAYYKPSVAITSRLDNSQAFFASVCKKAGLPPDAWQKEECSISRTTWIHLVRGAQGGTEEMMFLRRKSATSLHGVDLRVWLRSATQYLINNQQGDGNFAYRYDPLANHTRNEPVNSVRASGCIYALALAAECPLTCSLDGLANVTWRGIQAILARKVVIGNAAFIAENVKHGSKGSKLGTTALLAAALTGESFGNEFDCDAEQLRNSILACQASNGHFNCSFDPKGERDSQVEFFPGQALLALVLSNKVNVNPEHRKAWRLAFPYYRDHFRRKPSTAFVGWHAEVWSRLAIVDDKPEYADFVYEQIEWLLQYQDTSGTTSPTAGGFIKSGQTANYSSIVYTEALVRAVTLARERGDKKQFESYSRAAQNAISFCAGLQLDSFHSFILPNPQRAIGGFTKHLSNFEVRSDFVQHALTLGMAILAEPSLSHSCNE